MGSSSNVLTTSALIRARIVSTFMRVRLWNSGTGSVWHRYLVELIELERYGV
jgi:hypothetical protein